MGISIAIATNRFFFCKPLVLPSSMMYGVKKGQWSPSLSRALNVIMLFNPENGPQIMPGVERVNEEFFKRKQAKVL